MKAKYKLLSLLLATMPLVWTGCNDDDDNTTFVEEEIPELALDQKSIDVNVGNTATVEITQGGGDYKAFSVNEDIISVTLENNKLVITGLTNGKSAVIISDKNSNYIELSVRSLYDKIILDQENVSVKMPLGNSKTKTVKVLGGNGGYTASADKEGLVSLNVEKDQINVTALKEGKTTITVTDVMDITTTFTVNIETTTIPYDEEELEAIKANEDIRYVFNGRTVSSGDWGYELLNGKEGDMNVYGWDYYGWYYLKIYFPGDTSVGEKPGSKLSYEYYSGSNYSDEPIDFKIIKNDGTKIWATFSFVKDEKLNFGNFTMNME